MFTIYRDANGKFCKKESAVAMQQLVALEGVFKRNKKGHAIPIYKIGRNIYLPDYADSRKLDKKEYENETGSVAPSKMTNELELFEVHAKLEMTTGKKGGKIEMEAVTFAAAYDETSAKEKLKTEVFRKFPELAFSEIYFFANPTKSDNVGDGNIMFRSSKKAGWRQMEIKTFV